jgi:hypothetical protein
MPITTDFQATLNDTYAAALRGVVANHPTTTMEDLQTLVAEYPELGQVSLAELLSEPGKGKAPKATRKATGTKKNTRGKSPRWNMRTEEGREALKTAVLEGLRELGGEDVRAEQLRKRVEASAAQLRAMLNRLIEEGVLTYTGKARGTRYSLV